MRNFFILTFIVFASLPAFAVPLGEDPASITNSENEVEKMKLENAKRIIALQQRLINQQNKNLAVFNLITKGFQAGTICFYDQDTCGKRKSDLRLLTNNEVVVTSFCRLADRSELSSDCLNSQSYWFLETTVRVVSPSLESLAK